jgi:ATP-binding cassette, subfamily C (CFTR/MRP), member 1
MMVHTSGWRVQFWLHLSFSSRHLRLYYPSSVSLLCSLTKHLIILVQITYALSGHDLNIAVIFSSLQLFNVQPFNLVFSSLCLPLSPQVIRQPLIFLPFVLSILSDAVVALGRISKYLTADELDEVYKVDYARENAVEVDGCVLLTLVYAV